MTPQQLRESSNPAVRATWNFLNRRQRDYKAAFSGPAGQEVLKDLVKFCRGVDSTFHSDPRLHAVLEGRREVLLRITNHLHLSTDQLYMLANGQSTLTREDDQ